MHAQKGHKDDKRHHDSAAPTHLPFCYKDIKIYPLMVYERLSKGTQQISKIRNPYSNVKLRQGIKGSDGKSLYQLEQSQMLQD